MPTQLHILLPRSHHSSNLGPLSLLLPHQGPSSFKAESPFALHFTSLRSMSSLINFHAIFFVLLLPSFAIFTSALTPEGHSLLSLAKTLSLPNSVRSTWNSSHSTPCQWGAIECDNKLRVFSLNLSSHAISGRLGPEISGLRYIQIIDLSNNNLSGSVPPQITNCTQLEYLDFSTNSFTGTLPSDLQNLSYLECFVVHGNLLSDMEPHISDFGIAKLLNQSDVADNSTSVMGTPGYIAPEAAFTPIKNKESDVYSYGVVLLELITRKKVLDHMFPDNMDIVEWVSATWTNTQDIDFIVDPGLIEEFMDSVVVDQVTEVLMVALRCTERNPRVRPTMRDVVKKLEDAKPKEQRKFKQKQISQF